jgi:hypothetical protein
MVDQADRSLPAQGKSLKSHAPVASMEARRNSDWQVEHDRTGKRPGMLGQGEAMRHDVCERSTELLDPSCEAQKGFVHAW